MTEPRPSTPNPRPLTAYADGELGADQAIDALEQMASDPQATRQVMHQQQLRRAVARAMDDPAHTAPAELRARVEQMAASAGEPPSQPTRSHGPSPVLAIIGRWAPAAAAAVLLIGALVVLNTATHPDVMVQGIVPVSKVDEFAQRHVACSRMIDILHEDPDLHGSIVELPGMLAERFGNDTPGLDLSPIGYEFDRVGKCLVPGKGAVHLIYRAADDTDQDTISLWIRPDDGRLDLESGKLYVLAGKRKAHPLVVWLDGGLVYWITGDSMKGVERAADALRQDI